MSAQTTTLLPPVGGMDLKSPLANMDPRFSPFIQNFDSDGAKLSLRPAIKRFCDLSSVGNVGLALGTYSSSPNANYNLYCWVQGASSGIYDITSGAPVLGLARTAVPDEIFTSNYNNRLWFGTEIGEEAVYDGAAWANDSFVDSSAAAISWRFLTTYKSRAYLSYGSNTTGAIYYYTSAVGNVGGACVKVDLTSIFKTAGGIAWITSFSESDGIVNEVYLAFGNTAGEVLIYSGDYPGASNWTLAAEFVIGRPAGHQPIIPYLNDRFIMTYTGIVSLRNLFLSGQNAALSDNVSENIDPLWSSLIKQGYNPYFPGRIWSGVFWPEQNKIVILVQGNIDPDGVYSRNRTTFLVFDCGSKAWTTYMWQSGAPTMTYGAYSLTYYNGDLYFIFDASIMKMSTSFSNYIDTSPTNGTLLQTFMIKGPHQSLISQTTTKKIEGFEFLIKTDIDGQAIRVNCVSDFGRRVSDDARVAITVATSATSGYNRVKYSVGTEGAFYQYVFYGTALACVYGLEVYSVSTIFNPGGTKG